MKIKTQGKWLVGEDGRVNHLRGVNLGGSSKVPVAPDGSTWGCQDFYNHRQVSFVGRPFPLEEADEHFTRLRRWGLTFLRFLITWEAIEHEGPGLYDEAYLDYLYAVVKKAVDHDFIVFIDPHQDAWSRFSGGDGAPGWTFETLGMDVTKFEETGAAVFHQTYGDPAPGMIWPANYGRFAAATMWTLFFGGNSFAPETRIEGVPVETFLQEHYFGAVGQAVTRLKGLVNVIGYDTLNEPSQGYIGYPDVNRTAAELVARGPSPTIYEGMLLASGFSQEVVLRSRIPVHLGKSRRRRLNHEGTNLWLKGFKPVWRQNGVWDLDREGKPYLLRPDHFGTVNGQTVNFGRDFFAPFVRRYSRKIRAVDPQALIFVTPPPPELSYQANNYRFEGQEGLVYAPHWYDGLTVGFQRYIPWLGVDVHGGRPRFYVGRKRKRRNFAEQIGRLLKASEAGFGTTAPGDISPRAPTVIGETGIAFNLNNQAAYKNGDFSKQIEAMDDTIQALEANLVSFTLWNYTADNNNEGGDLWNGEDMSIFSRDQMIGASDIHDGGRALEAIVRPYAHKIPGTPLSMRFDIKSRLFEFTFRHERQVEGPLELFVPDFQYPNGVVFEASGGRIEHDRNGLKAYYYPEAEPSIHTVRIFPKSTVIPAAGSE